MVLVVIIGLLLAIAIAIVVGRILKGTGYFG